MKRAPTISRSAGFSLLELMISIVLGLLLIAGAVATYISSKRSYSETEQFSTLSETARFAELTMADALLHAGFFGEAPAHAIVLDSAPVDPIGDCNGPTTLNGRGAADAFNVERYIFGGIIASGGGALSKATGGAAITCITDGREGTDVLIVKRAIPLPITDGLRADEVQTRDGVLDSPNPLQPNTLYVLSNNITGMLFNGSATQPNITEGGDVFNGTAWPYLFEAYYVRDADPDSEAVPPTLARKTIKWNGAAMEIQTEDLVEGVEDMRLRIGLDTDADKEIDSYTEPSVMTVDDWGTVGSVEVYLLVRSSTRDPQFTDTRTYHLGGDNTVTPVAGDDPNVDLRQFRRLRVSTQASLRNPKLILQR